MKKNYLIFTLTLIFILSISILLLSQTGEEERPEEFLLGHGAVIEKNDLGQDIYRWNAADASPTPAYTPDGKNIVYKADKRMLIRCERFGSNADRTKIYETEGMKWLFYPHPKTRRGDDGVEIYFTDNNNSQTMMVYYLDNDNLATFDSPFGELYNMHTSQDSNIFDLIYQIPYNGKIGINGEFETEGSFPLFSPNPNDKAIALYETKTWIGDRWQMPTYYGPEDFESGIAIINPDYEVLQIVQSGTNPRWHPNGELIIYDHWHKREQSSIHITDLDGNDIKLIENGRNPDFSPKGRYIAYEVFDKGIWLYDAKRKTKTQLFHKGKDPLFSPDGETLLFVDGEDICVIDLR